MKMKLGSRQFWVIKQKIFMNIRSLSFTLFAVLVLLLSSNMKAEIDETIVAASLFPVSIDDSANSINVISAEDIENTPHLNLADLLRDLPGISVSQSGVLGSQIQVRVRGSEANHLLVLVDGVEVNNASQNDEFNWGNIIPTDIEKIEVIRGPQSSMFGSDAMAMASLPNIELCGPRITSIFSISVGMIFPQLNSSFWEALLTSTPSTRTRRWFASLPLTLT